LERNVWQDVPIVPGETGAPKRREERPMEELLVLILQFFFEFLVQLLAYCGVDFAAHRTSERGGCGYGCVSFVVFALIGGLFGAVMNLMHPGLIIPWPGARVAGLFIWPPFAGVIAYGIAYCWRYRGRSANLWPHFWNAFCFVLAFNLIRFIYGAR
jgi:hypothetical protein